MGHNLPGPAPIAGTNKKARKEWQHSIETDNHSNLLLPHSAIEGRFTNDAKEGYWICG
jgi:hypothetical protein